MAGPDRECSVVRMGDGSSVRVQHPAGHPPSPEALEALAKLKSYLEAHPEGPAKGEDLVVDLEEGEDVADDL